MTLIHSPFNDQRVVLTDVDNTLFSWIDFFGPCFRALVHAVAQSSGFAEDALYDNFQLLFREEGSVEYKRAIQENDLIRRLSGSEVDRLVHVGSVAFGQAAKHHLRPYDDVKTTLRHLRADGVKVVAVTNSGALQALYRLRSLGLGKHLDGLVAWDHDVAGAADAEYDYKILLQSRVRLSGLPWAIALPKERLKPDRGAYEEALRRVGLPNPRMWIIGDSLHKDLSSAVSLGATSIWARYGHEFNERNFETLLRITHWSPEKVRATYDVNVLDPDHVAESFGILLDVVDRQQCQLF